MDEYLEDAWQNAYPPFHGTTVRNENSVTLTRLLSALTIVTEWLECRYGRNAKLLMLDDWHEHDGFLLTGTRIEWPALRAMTADEARFAKTCTGDFDVYRAIYPISGEWLMRWYIGDEDPPECEFTFSAHEGETREVAALLQPTIAVSVEESGVYFRKHYAG